ncbi:MAG: hypothetical protein U9R08_00555 [Nanoarchaeota archaeon]|nr:hypothetical protein [Nanoarchaeota archaeon]
MNNPYPSINEFLHDLRAKACKRHAKLEISYKFSERDYIDSEDHFEISYTSWVRKGNKWRDENNFKEICRLPDNDSDNINDVVDSNARYIGKELIQNRNTFVQREQGSKIYFIIRKAVRNA